MEELVSLKCPYYPKQSVDSMQFLLKYQLHISKIYIEPKKIPKISAILRKNNKVVGITIPDIKLYYKATVIKIVWYRHRNRATYVNGTIESPEINSCLYGQLLLNKEGTSIQWSKRPSLQQMVLGKLYWYLQNNESRLPTYTINQNKLKMDEILQYNF